MDVRLSVFVATILVTGLPMGPAFGQETSLDSSTYQYSQPIEPTFSDVSYATLSPSVKLDLYLPAAEARPAPVMIWIHGGGFRVGDKDSMPRSNFGPPPTPKALSNPSPGFSRADPQRLCGRESQLPPPSPPGRCVCRLCPSRGSRRQGRAALSSCQRSEVWS
ncbi:MAG: carboxylesterase family protein [Verrucomicrobia bacterium]|nr:carboxylesterase family protein [Verrucomicrobiota bacterium]